jgi:hypothetical protein
VRRLAHVLTLALAIGLPACTPSPSAPLVHDVAEDARFVAYAPALEPFACDPLAAPPAAG